MGQRPDSTLRRPIGRRCRFADHFGHGLPLLGAFELRFIGIETSRYLHLTARPRTILFLLVERRQYRIILRR